MDRIPDPVLRPPPQWGINGLCPICYKSFASGTQVSMIRGCGHLFHFACLSGGVLLPELLEARRQNRSIIYARPECPYCRTKFSRSSDWIYELRIERAGQRSLDNISPQLRHEVVAMEQKLRDKKAELTWLLQHETKQNEKLSVKRRLIGHFLGKDHEYLADLADFSILNLPKNETKKRSAVVLLKKHKIITDEQYSFGLTIPLLFVLFVLVGLYIFIKMFLY